jgi:hypothetical protein
VPVLARLHTLLGSFQEIAARAGTGGAEFFYPQFIFTPFRFLFDYALLKLNPVKACV